MQVIIQQEATGCGIASVANIVQHSYAEVKAIANQIGIYATDTALYSDSHYVRRLLTHFDWRAAPTETPFTHWDALPDTALLAIKWHQQQGVPFWHWCVFKRVDGHRMVLDSAAYLEKNCITDLSKLQPKWFIAVTKAN